MAASLVAAAPVIPLSILPFLIFLHSPAYMVHQVEEHTGGRFRRFAIENIFGGRDALTVTAILVVTCRSSGASTCCPSTPPACGDPPGAWSPLR